MKKIFILTGEPSGDKLASKVINDLKKINPNVEYLSVGGENLKTLGIKSIYNIKEITYLGFTSVVFNLFKIYKKINQTTKAIIDYNPDILFTVDSPDFTLRVAKKVKKINSKIKTVHYVAPQVWVWREGRVKKIKKYIDHILLLFNFEKKYFEKENFSYEFVGHPLLEKSKESKIDINQIIGKNKALISIFPGSRRSEIATLMPILKKFIKLMNNKYSDITYTFHSTIEYSDLVKSFLHENDFSNCDVISDNKIKLHILQKSIFAVAKSGTVALEICNAKVPSLIIYKTGMINYFIIKALIKTKFVNIVNFAANEEIIPELLQSDCNPKKIFQYVESFLENPNKIKNQVEKVQKILNDFKTNKSSSELASLSLNKFLK